MADTPQRIQLRRTKGWRKPKDTIIVARPSRWGNWYVVSTAREMYGGARGPYASVLTDAPVVYDVDKRGMRRGGCWAGFANDREARQFAVDMYRAALEGTYVSLDGAENREWYLGPLRGHNLGCWCKPGEPCHADVLLELANQGGPR